MVHAWATPDMGTDPLARAVGDPSKLAEQARRELHHVVDEADESGLVSPIGRTLVHDGPAPALLDAATGADMLMVGSPLHRPGDRRPTP